MTGYLGYVILHIAMDNTEQNNNRIQYGGKLDPVVYAVVDRLREEEDRPFSNMIERLLKTHPRVQEMLGNGQGETAAAGVN